MVVHLVTIATGHQVASIHAAKVHTLSLGRGHPTLAHPKSVSLLAKQGPVAPPPALTAPLHHHPALPAHHPALPAHQAPPIHQAPPPHPAPETPATITRHFPPYFLHF